MKTKIGSYQAKTYLPQLLKRVVNGERITITKHGVPIAQLIPVEQKLRRDLKTVIEEMKAFSKAHKLGKMSIRELVEEGRKY